jgi:hypothetical protein
MRRFILPAATLALLMGGARQAHAGFCTTLSMASWGNGTLGRGDFSSFVWETKGGKLDLTKELVGQPAGGALWGTAPGALGSGDFSSFNNDTDPAARSATSYFQPAAGGSYGEMINLTALHRTRKRPPPPGPPR